MDGLTIRQPGSVNAPGFGGKKIIVMRLVSQINKATVKAIWKHSFKMGYIPSIQKKSARIDFDFGSFVLFYLPDYGKGPSVILGIKPFIN